MAATRKEPTKEPTMLNYRLSGLSILAGIAALPFATPARAADAKPNIVYIVSDDLGWKDVGFNGCATSRRRTSTSSPRTA